MTCTGLPVNLSSQEPAGHPGPAHSGGIRIRARHMASGRPRPGSALKNPFRKVGRHRRFRFEDLMDYKRRDDRDRRVAADKLAELTEDLGLY